MGSSRLLRAGVAAFQTLWSDLAGTEVALVLTDPLGCVLHRAAALPAFESALDDAGVAVGHDLSERSAGTNAVALTLLTRDVGRVSGDCHYLDRLRGLDGIGAPVCDPVHGRVVGVVAVFTAAGLSDGTHLALVRQTARLVEHHLLLPNPTPQQRLLSRYLSAARTSEDPVVAIGDHSFHAGSRALRVLGGLTHEDLWPVARNALSEVPHAEVSLTNPAGATVTLRLRGVTVDGALIGAVGDVFDESLLDAKNGVATLAVPEFAAWSPAARRAALSVRRAAEERRPVCLLGEEGTGRATTVRIVASRVFPGRNVVHLTSAEATVERVVEELERDVPVMVQDAHFLPAAQLFEVVSAARAAPSDGWLALTYTGDPMMVDEHLAEARVSIVACAPLRARPRDIEVVLPALVRRHAGGRELALTPALVDRLRREPWPTNFHGLDAVVAEMVGNASDGTLDVRNLPVVFGTLRRRKLTPLEWMTRSAIVSALQASGGNKELAAESLGMSRAWIYRKIKAFDIRAGEATATD